MHETRNMLMKREIYRSFSEKKNLVSSEKREICCFFFTGTVFLSIGLIHQIFPIRSTLYVTPFLGQNLLLFVFFLFASITSVL